MSLPRLLWEKRKEGKERREGEKEGEQIKEGKEERSFT